MRRFLLPMLVALMAMPAAAQMGGMTAQEVANDSGLLPKRGQTPRRVQGPTITRLETATGRTGYTLWGYPSAEGPVFRLVVLLYRDGEGVTGVAIDGARIDGAFTPGGRGGNVAFGATGEGQPGNVQVPLPAELYQRGLTSGLQVEVLGQPSLRLTVPVDYFRGYDARYRSVFGG